jgi:hypothetical protein
VLLILNIKFTGFIFILDCEVGLNPLFLTNSLLDSTESMNSLDSKEIEVVQPYVLS